MLWTRREAIAGFVGGLALLKAPRASAEAAYPDRTIKFIVPYPAGGTTDLLGRMVADQLQSGLGATVVVENKPGVATVLAAETVARAEPDGYTLMIATSTTLAVNKTLYKKLPYDPVKDFTPIALVAAVPFALIVNPQIPAANLKEFIAYAKANPGLAYGSAGNGSPHHLGAEMLKTAAGIDIRHVSYRGSVPAMLDVIAGRIPFMVMDLQPALPQIRAGKVRVLGRHHDQAGRGRARYPDARGERPCRLRTRRLAGRGRTGRPAAPDRRQDRRADRKARSRSRHAREIHRDRARAIARIDAGQFCGLHQDRSRSLGRDRQAFRRRTGMTADDPWLT